MSLVLGMQYHVIVLADAAENVQSESGESFFAAGFLACKHWRGNLPQPSLPTLFFFLKTSQLHPSRIISSHSEPEHHYLHFIHLFVAPESRVLCSIFCRTIVQHVDCTRNSLIPIPTNTTTTQWMPQRWRIRRCTTSRGVFCPNSALS